MFNKFKNKKADDKVPEGVKLEYSSFGQPQSGYNPNVLQQNTNNSTGNSSGNQNGNQNNTKVASSSLAATSVWANDDDSVKIESHNTQKAAKGKPNFMQKNVPQPPPPVQVQQQVPQQTQIAQPINKTPATTATTTGGQRQEINLKIENQPAPKKTKFEIRNELDLLDDNELNFPDLEYQKKLVNDITAPGGIRPKQQEDVLNSFADDCQSLPPCVIGSLLINKLFSNEQNIVKQRSLYAAEILVKKQQRYQEFFKKQQFMIQKSQQFNLNDNKFVSLSNQLLAVVSNPSLEISEASDINFNFSQAKDLSKFGKQNEQPATQQSTAKVSGNNNVDLINDLLDGPATTTFVPAQQPTQQPKSTGLFDKMKKNKAISENPSPMPHVETEVKQQQPGTTGGETKGKLFGKFKPKSNNASSQNENGDLLSLVDDQVQKSNTNGNNHNQNSNGTQNLQDKFSLLNLYTPDNNNNNGFHQPAPNTNNQYYAQPPQFNQFPPHNQQPGFYSHPPQGYNAPHQTGGYPPYQNNGYHPYPPQHQGYGTYGQQPNNQYGYNNNGFQQGSSTNYSTIYMEFGENKQNNLEQQLYNTNNFKLDENTPDQKNSKQEQKKPPINEDAFDFIAF